MIDFAEISEKMDRRYSLVSKSGVEIVVSDALRAESGICHGFTTRIGGVSPSPFDTLNFSLSRADNPENVIRNLKLLSASYGLDFNKLAFVNHEHGTKVIRIDSSHCGCGITREKLPFCDGLVTNDPNVTLLTCHADCGAIFVYDRKRKAIGLAHSGWRGTLNRIGSALVEKMHDEFGSEPQSLIAALGPCICKKCFEVDAELGERFRSEFDYPGIMRPGRTGKAYVDIEAALAIQLAEAGILKHNISSMDLCTFENRDLFFSYRRDGIGTGAMVSFLTLK